MSVYYVNKDGVDNASGTKEDPFNTPEQVRNIAIPGDIVCFMDGIEVDPEFKYSPFPLTSMYDGYEAVVLCPTAGCWNFLPRRMK